MTDRAIKSILVTGASRGIGLAIAKFLLGEGHNVCLVARTQEPFEALKKEFPGRVVFACGNVNDLELGPKAVSTAIESFQQLDGLILNHGTLSPVTRIADASPQDWSSCFQTNLVSLISFITPAIPHLRAAAHGGRIILTSSGAATNGYATWGAYGASKAALNHLALTLRNEETQITTIAVRPGVVDTEMQVEVRGHAGVMDASDAKKFKDLHEGGKLLRPEQPANVMGRLALGASESLSGKFLSWDAKELAEYQDS